MSKASTPILVRSLGHSNLPWPRFLELLESVGTDAVLDVRSRPRSRFPHFCQAALRTRLNLHGIAYQHLPELGGDVPVSCGYEEAARTPAFLAGIDRLLDAARRCRVGMVCSEGDPLACHRVLLVARVLAARGVHVAHLLRCGRIEAHWQTELRLLQATGCGGDHLWSSDKSRLAEAYLKQEQRVRRIK